VTLNGPNLAVERLCLADVTSPAAQPNQDLSASACISIAGDVWAPASRLRRCRNDLIAALRQTRSGRSPCQIHSECRCVRLASNFVAPFASTQAGQHDLEVVVAKTQCCSGVRKKNQKNQFGKPGFRCSEAAFWRPHASRAARAAYDRSAVARRWTPGIDYEVVSVSLGGVVGGGGGGHATIYASTSSATADHALLVFALHRPCRFDGERLMTRLTALARCLRAYFVPGRGRGFSTRAAVLTVSPMTVKSRRPPPPMVPQTALPDLTPRPTRSSSPSLRDARGDVKGGASALVGVVWSRSARRRPRAGLRR